MRFCPFLLAALVAVGVACSPGCGWDEPTPTPTFAIEGYLSDATGLPAILCLSHRAGWVPVKEALPGVRAGSEYYMIELANGGLFTLQAYHPYPERHADYLALVWNDAGAHAFGTLPACDLAEYHRSYYAGRG